MKLFIWDFHGVLEKGNRDAVLEITNLALEKNGFLPKLTSQKNNQLYGKKWFEYFEYLLPQENHNIHMKIQSDCIKIEKERPDILDKYIKTNDYAIEVLDIISQKYQQILISNCHEKALYNFIFLTKVGKYFDQNNTFSTNSHFFPEQLPKKEIFTDYIKKFPKFDQFVTIGDSPGDMEIIDKNMGSRYLYSHPGQEFRDCDSDYKIHDLREVLKEI